MKQTMMLACAHNHDLKKIKKNKNTAFGTPTAIKGDEIDGCDDSGPSAHVNYLRMLSLFQCSFMSDWVGQCEFSNCPLAYTSGQKASRRYTLKATQADEKFGMAEMALIGLPSTV